MLKRIFCFLISSLVVMGVGWGAVPEKISYEGRLTDASGTAITSAKTISFSLYDAATDGNKLWGPESHSVTPDSQGVFSVLLGGATALSSGVFSASSRYIEVSIGDETLSPRTQLVSVGYAFRSALADSVDDGSISTAKISDKAVTTAKLADSSVTDAKIVSLSGSKVIGTILPGAHASSHQADASDALTITTGMITNEAVTAAKLSVAAIDSATGKIPALSSAYFSNLDGANLTNLGTAQIADYGIIATKIATNAVTSVKILDGEIVNADINAGAAIVDTKLATISTAGKVSGAALTSLANIPSGAGTIPTARLDVGTGASQIIQLDGSARLPVVDGSQLLNLSISSLAAANVTTGTFGAGVYTFPSDLTVTGTMAVDMDTLYVDAGANKVGVGTAEPASKLTVAGTIESKGTGGIKFPDGTTQITAAAGTSGTVTSVSTGTGLIGGPITATGTISIDAGGVGTAQLAATSVTAAKLGSDVAGTGLTGGNGSALAVDVGTTASKIVQLDGSARLPAVDGSNLTAVVVGDNSVTSAKIVDGTIAAADFGTGVVTSGAIAADTINAAQLADTITLDTTLEVTQNDYDVNFDANTLFVDGSADSVGIGTAAPLAALHVIGTTEQLRLGYDASNYVSFEVGSSGNLEIDPTGILKYNLLSSDIYMYGTADETTNYERLRFYTTGGTFQILTEKGGSGVAENIWIGDGGNTFLMLNPVSGVMGFCTSIPDSKFEIAGNDGNNSSLSKITGITHAVTGTAAIGSGPLLTFRQENDKTGGNERENIAAIGAVLEDATDGSTDGALVFHTMRNEAAAVERMRINSLGQVGIGTIEPFARLEVEVANAANAKGVLIDYDDATNNLYALEINNAGTGDSIYDDSGAKLTAAGVFTDASDRSKKTNISAINYGTEELMKLRPVNYQWTESGQADIGFVAQELKEVIPEVVHGEEGDLSVSYGHLTALLAKTVQEQQKKIEELSAKVAALEQTKAGK